MIRVELPYHLRTLAKVDGEVQLNVEGQVTQRSVLDALEIRIFTDGWNLGQHLGERLLLWLAQCLR